MRRGGPKARGPEYHDRVTDKPDGDEMSKRRPICFTCLLADLEESSGGLVARPAREQEGATWTHTEEIGELDIPPLAGVPLRRRTKPSETE